MSDLNWNEAWRTADGVPEVSTAWTAEALGKARVIDIREPNEWAGPLHKIADIEFIPMGDVAEACKNWDKDEALVIMCRSGGRSAHIALFLEQQGFTKAVSVAGGMIKWNQEGRPIV